MKSYALIDRIEGSYAICEVELLDLEIGQNVDYCDRETTMIEIPIDVALYSIESLAEGDILVVAHDGKIITQIFGKDYEEKQRRVEYLNKL